MPKLNEVDQAESDLKYKLLTNFLFFMKTFFPLVTGREFLISNPVRRESHFIIISDEFQRAANLEILSILCNVPPGSGKSTICSMWVAWTMARWQNSQYLYVSYGKTLATKHTEFTRRIIQHPYYKLMFGIEIRPDSKAKDHFQTVQGGSVKAFGSSGAITGQDAGLPNCEHFTGAIILDDMHKPDEVHSDTIRQTVIDNYRETILQRPRGPNVPIIFIGQRLHEDDLPAYLLSGQDERTWTPLILKGIDDNGNALYPEVNSLASLLDKQEKNPYVFASQYQQNPIPAGGALFKDNYFLRLAEEPELICTFITADTAETSKSYNDATAFSFWGVYYVIEGNHNTGRMALHWLDCAEIRVEPKDLKDEFMSFYADCMTHKTKPLFAAIEKKSTGATLVSVLSDMRGLDIREVKRTKVDGSKATRFLEMQPILASKLVTFTDGAKHVPTCVNHMMKITANDTHRWDDICHAAGSKIATIHGSKNVEDIRIGDKIITPFGVGIVSACGLTGHHKVINKLGLLSTPDHPVYTEKGFLPLDIVNDADKIDILSFKGLLRWRTKKRLYLMEKNIHAESRESIIEVAQEIQKTKLFIGPFLNFIAAKKYQKALMFITSMAIDLIIIMKIWSFYRAANMLKSIQSKLKSSKTYLKNGIKAQKVENGIAKMLKNAPIRYLRSGYQYALSAIKNLFSQNLASQPKLAVCHVTPKNIEEILETSRPYAQFATTSSQQKSVIHNQEIEKHAPICAEETLVPVYALTVEKYGVYYCNGILLKNCDTCYDAVKIALIDKNANHEAYYQPTFIPESYSGMFT